jgi:hypothetical protein
MASTRPGHIERLPIGSYRVIVYAGTDPLTGRRLRFRRTVKTEEQAQILLGKLLEQVAEGRQVIAGPARRCPGNGPALAKVESVHAGRHTDFSPRRKRGMR